MATSRDPLVRASKFMSLVLRHDPGAANVVLDANGWAEIDQLVAGSRGKLTRDLVERVVRENDKKRFALSDDGARVRAVQGHSVSVELDLKPATPPRRCCSTERSSGSSPRSCAKGSTSARGSTSTCPPMPRPRRRWAPGGGGDHPRDRGRCYGAGTPHVLPCGERGVADGCRAAALHHTPLGFTPRRRPRTPSSLPATHPRSRPAYQPSAPAP